MSVMNTTNFEGVVNHTCAAIKKTLTSKAKEYSQHGDRLHNFNVASTVNGIPVDKSIWYMATKHLTCVIDMVNSVDLPTTEMVEEKIGDLINYLVILKAHYHNEISQEVQKNDV